MRELRGRLTIATPAPDAYLIRITRRLDVLTGVRVLRLLDARLALARAGATPTRCVLVDVTGLDCVEHVGVRLLERAAVLARTQGVELALVGVDAMAERDRARLAGVPAFTSLALALDALRLPSA